MLTGSNDILKTSNYMREEAPVTTLYMNGLTILSKNMLPQPCISNR